MEDHNLDKELSISDVLYCNLYTWMDNISKIASERYFQKKLWCRLHKMLWQKSDLGYFREIDVQYPKKLYRLYNDLLFLQDMGTKKCKSILCSSHHKRKYFANIRTLKQGLKHGLI